MSNSTQCELCGDNKSDKSLYCIYCQAINEIKPNQGTQPTHKLTVPLHKKKTLTAIVIISVCVLIMLIASTAFDYTYNMFASIKSNMKKILAALVALLLIGVVVYRYKENQNNESESEDKSSSSSNEASTESNKNIEQQELLEPEEEERDLGEVFHVSDKSYTYNEARAICNKYGADLATPSQVYKMYLKGVSWCNPGWSEGQHVIFPATEKSVNEANSNPETKGSCGKIGLNGMFEKNMSSKFGANCWQGGEDIDSSGI